MRATGGQYKCWRGFTAVSVSPDGRYALVLGNRSAEKKADKKADKKSKKSRKRGTRDKEPEPDEAAEEVGEAAEGDDGDGEPMPTDDVPVAPPSGKLSLYRAQLDGAYTTSPALIAHVVEGAAVWVPTK